jgi:hypothetical protein
MCQGRGQHPWLVYQVQTAKAILRHWLLPPWLAGTATPRHRLMGNLWVQRFMSELNQSIYVYSIYVTLAATNPAFCCLPYQDQERRWECG